MAALVLRNEFSHRIYVCERHISEVNFTVNNNYYVVHGMVHGDQMYNK